MTIGIDASRSIDTIQKTGVEKVSDELLRQFIEIKNQKSKIMILILFSTPPNQLTGYQKKTRKFCVGRLNFFGRKFVSLGN